MILVSKPRCLVTKPVLVNNIMFSRGFTLIETFVAISILLLAVLGPLLAIAGFFRDNNFARNQIQAAYFAQDGAEKVKNIIVNKTSFSIGNDRLGDGSCKVDRNWLGSLTNKCTSGNPCNIDDDGNIPPSSSGNLTSATGQKYTRQIVITPHDNRGSPFDDTDDRSYLLETNVNVNVSWSQGSMGSKSVTLDSLVVTSLCQ